MKRLIVFILAALMLLNICACSGNSQNNTEKATATAEPSALTETPSSTEEPASTDTPAETDGPANPDPVSPLMWRVTDSEGHTLYLFGTIHAGDERNEAVLEKVSGTLESCDALAVEFDVVAYEKDTAQMMKDIMQYLLTDGTSITDHMPKELYDRSYELLDKADMYPALLKQYNLAMWAQMVDSAMLVLYSDLDTEMAMDSMLINRANDKGIPVLDVESGEFQMTLLNSFDDELYLLVIEETLDSADTYGSELNELYSLWLSGDRDGLWGLLLDEYDYDEIYENYTEEQVAMVMDYNRKLLDDRNLGMRDRAIEYLESGQTVFFAVGAAHMANEAGLVQLLTDAGYTVDLYAY